MSDTPAPEGPDLEAGIAASELADGTLLAGHVGEASVLLARRGDQVFAVDGTCRHYGAPLHDGLLVGDTVRCPWHHACFSLRDGAALRAPALDGLGCWRVERSEDRIVVRERLAATPTPSPARRDGAPASVVIVGGGAAGNAAAEMLRREGYTGRVVMVSADTVPPVDRPNLSKSYLAGTAAEDWIPLRPAGFYDEHRIELLLGTHADALETATRRLRLADGRVLPYDALLLATGAEPVRLRVPGAELPHVHTLRTLDDARAIVTAAASARRAVVIGASFIGLEAAAALTTRGLEVHVVAPEAVPMERVFGGEIGRLVRATHEQHGVRFHLGATAVTIDPQAVTLGDGTRVAADLVVVGIGVRPALALAESAGLTIDRGVVVDARLETSVPGIYAAGDIARWPDRASGESWRIEHWVVAERQGQTAARNLLGADERFDAVPFFWTEQFDLTINYVGHAEQWDTIAIDGSLDARDATVRYRTGGRVRAVATIRRDRASLEAERELETGVTNG